MAQFLNIQKMWMKFADLMSVTITVIVVQLRPPQPSVMTRESGTEMLSVIDVWAHVVTLMLTWWAAVFLKLSVK
jgi:hypothetical protein